LRAWMRKRAALAQGLLSKRKPAPLEILTALEIAAEAVTEPADPIAAFHTRPASDSGVFTCAQTTSCEDDNLNPQILRRGAIPHWTRWHLSSSLSLTLHEWSSGQGRAIVLGRATSDTDYF
jgi:hypothetical protein